MYICQYIHKRDWRLCMTIIILVCPGNISKKYDFKMIAFHWSASCGLLTWRLFLNLEQHKQGTKHPSKFRGSWNLKIFNFFRAEQIYLYAPDFSGAHREKTETIIFVLCYLNRACRFHFYCNSINIFALRLLQC